MNTVARKPRHQRCALCGRIAETGKSTDLGWTGPECQRKVAALPALLDSLGIDTGLIVQVRAQRAEEFGDVEYAHPHGALQQRLSRAGLTLERVGAINWRSDPPVATFRVSVKRVRQFNQAIKSFTQTRREFEERLREGRRRRVEGSSWSHV